VEEPIPLRDAAQQFGVKVDRLRRAAWDGRLNARLLGNQWIVVPSEVQRFLREGGRRTHTEPAQRREGDHMARIIAIAVPKGGTGKTTTTINLGAALAEQGKRVLLVDFDPQGSLTLALGMRPDDQEHTIYSAMKYYLSTFEPQLDLAIRPTPTGADLVPATIRLNLANAELTIAPQGELVLKKLLTPLTSRYDFILIDTLPYLGILVENALVAAHEVLIPLEAEYLATESVSLMLQQIQFMRKSGLNPELGVSGILLTHVDTRTLLNRQFADFARKEFGNQVHVFETVIKRSVRFPESQAFHQSILQYDPQGDGARAYRAVAEEMLHEAD
jgi:chromosome partitioning protein